jgi:hypothetical protein
MSGSGGVVRVRTPQRALLPFYVLALVPLAFLSINVWTIGDDAGLGPWPYVVWGAMLLLVAAFVVVGVLRPPGVDLRDDAAVVVGPLRRRVVPWRDVRSVTFGRRGMLTLHRADGTETRCRYPAEQTPFVPPNQVDTDFHRIEQWWQARRTPVAGP